MAKLDLTDTKVWEMANRNHLPDEAWNASGQLVAVFCRTCAHSYPCPTRRACDEVAQLRVTAYRVSEGGDPAGDQPTP